MTVSNITVLSLLGKDVSFSVLLDEQKKPFFPDGIQVSGTVEEVIIALNGNHQILVCNAFPMGLRGHPLTSRKGYFVYPCFSPGIIEDAECIRTDII